MVIQCTLWIDADTEPNDPVHDPIGIHREIDRFRDAVYLHRINRIRSGCHCILCVFTDFEPDFQCDREQNGRDIDAEARC